MGWRGLSAVATHLKNICFHPSSQAPGPGPGLVPGPRPGPAKKDEKHQNGAAKYLKGFKKMLVLAPLGLVTIVVDANM